MPVHVQVLASVFGPREVDVRSDMQQDKAIIKCEYAMAAFSTGAAGQHRCWLDSVQLLRAVHHHDAKCYCVAWGN
jgi:ribonuclease PH